MKFGNQKAFTLSELLITITIIGVVAVLVLPNLIKKNEERVLLSKFKQTYSILNQAHMANIAEYGSGYVANSESVDDTFEMFLKHLKTTEVCRRTFGCFPDVRIKSFNPKEGYCSQLNIGKALYPKLRLYNGASVVFGYWGNGKFPMAIYIDVNSDKKPNRFGYDVFALNIGHNPKNPDEIDGGGSWNWMRAKSRILCSLKDRDCNSMFSGFSCAQWVIRHGNFDYMHRDISDEEWKEIFR